MTRAARRRRGATAVAAVGFRARRPYDRDGQPRHPDRGAVAAELVDPLLPVARADISAHSPTVPPTTITWCNDGAGVIGLVAVARRVGDAGSLPHSPTNRIANVDDLCRVAGSTGVDEQLRSSRSPGCTSPASWTATGVGPGSTGCRGRPATPRARRTWPASCASPCARDIGWLTVFGFSTENWIRPRAEVRHILGLHEKLFGRIRELNELERAHPVDRAAVRHARRAHPEVRPAGDPQGDRRHRRNTGMVLTVAFDYGSRAELMAAVAAARGRRAGHAGGDRRPPLLPELPPVDVMVRTSGERRVSNFLLWQGAGVEDPLHRQRLARLRRRRSRRRDRARRSMTVDAAASGRRRASTHGHRRALPAAEDRARAAADGARRSPTRSSPGGTSWSRPARAPARRSPTSSRRSCRASAPIVATATKALQDQLATKDLPFVVAQLAEQGIDARLGGAQGALQLPLPAAPPRGHRPRPGAARARADVGHASGPRSPGSPSGRAGRAPATPPSSTGARPTRRGGRSASAATSAPAPTAARWAASASPSSARDRAQVADVVVVNTHLYGIDVGAIGAIMPEHEVVVFDEAHGLEDIMSDTVGVEIAPGRFVTRRCRGARHPGRPRRRRLDRRAGVDGSPGVLGSYAGQRLRDRRCPTRSSSSSSRRGCVLVRTSEALQAIETSNEDAQQRGCGRLAMLTRTLRVRRRRARPSGEGTVAFVSGQRRQPAARDRPARRRPDDAVRRVGPAHGGPHQRNHPGVARSRVGLPAERDRPDRRRQPVRLRRHRRCSTARCTSHRRSRRATATPSPTSWSTLIGAAGGRTLALFTSWAALDHAVGRRPRARRRPDPHPARPAQAGAGQRLRRVGGNVPVRHDRAVPGRRRARARRCRWS